jgi:ABC-type transport system involved in cytochrome c biogenesis permease subunit
MSETLKSINATIPTAKTVDAKGAGRLIDYLPALLPLLGAALVVTLRIKGGPGAVPSDGTMIVWAVLAYIFAAAALMTNLWAPIGFLQKLGVWAASFGFFANLSSWLVRWIAAGDRENWIRMTNQITGAHDPWGFFSYIPFANLYDLSLAFAFGAAFATLLISHRPGSRFIGALSMPLITLILLLAVFIGNEFINLPPVLDSYWRPIHVGVASLSYGVALVSFALAVMFLIKDGVKIESMGVAVAAAIVAGFLYFSNSFSLLPPAYRLNPVIEGANGVMSIRPLRVALPGVGYLLAISILLLFAVAVCFLLYLYRNSEPARRYGHWALRASLVTQGAGIIWLFYQLKTMRGVGSLVDAGQYRALGEWMAGDNAAGMPVDQLVQGAQNWLGQNAGAMVFNVRSNPVEIASLIAAFALTLFVALFSLRTEQIRASLPSLERLDALIYKTVGTAFAGIAILLVTGAVWANESWGRYWGWDPKETGALVAWLAYAGYLHTRVAHGWSGRRGAYFALAGFLLVIFTYLGVSYLLPGLHSYA